MQFDHYRLRKEFNIGGILNNSWENVKKELEKCQLLCANCHMIKTNERKTIVEDDTNIKHINRGTDTHCANNHEWKRTTTRIENGKKTCILCKQESWRKSQKRRSE